MIQVLLGMGSNIEAEYHLKQAAAALRTRFAEVHFSSVYQSAAIGMDGDDFLNACCLFESELSEQELIALLKSMEDKQGRDRSRGSWKPRTLDLDVLMYDGQVVDDELHRYAHASVPASELVEITVPDDSAAKLTQLALRL
ncbi:MAG: 2-amino-4-hydroxy-6-hydroxymethyldihydropteridine diphosphokinase [Mariprofundus sp.]|nr:2-amino-4-hydroxy-6-hydroxymethyldihydropteridine diphosphokinase [Mariprofundus sp.]